MKKRLKYLILIIFAAIAWISGTEASDSTIPTNPLNDATSETASYTYDSANPNACLLPCQTSYANSFRPPSTTKRTNNAHKNLTASIKTCKTFNSGIPYLYNKESLIAYLPFIKPAHRLISLGKLII